MSNFYLIEIDVLSAEVRDGAWGIFFGIFLKFPGNFANFCLVGYGN